MRPIVKINDMNQRIPEQGRIRFGVKVNGKPKSIDKFRFTSADQEAIDLLAEKYGGTPEPWADAKQQGQWQVVTNADKIRVVLPPDPLQDTPIYELWAGGGVLRRCDGEVALVPRKTPDGAEMAETPCICDAEQQMACKPKTRLNVILPDIPFGGTWRLETGGWNAAQELPGMVAAVQQVQDRGFVVAALTLVNTTSTFAGQTRKFVVPRLHVDATIEELVAGQGSLGSLGPASAPPPPLQLIAAEEPFTTVYEDDHFEDAELAITEEQASQIYALMALLELNDHDFTGFVRRISGGSHGNLHKLSDTEGAQLLRVLERISAGEMSYQGLNDQGLALVSKS